MNDVIFAQKFLKTNLESTADLLLRRTLLAKPYPDVQKLPRNAGSSYFYFEFSFRLLSHFRYHMALRPAIEKPNSRKNMIFHIFCLIEKLSKMPKFAKLHFGYFFIQMF